MNLPYLKKIAESAAHLVWWKPEQVARGENVENSPTKGERPWIVPETTGQFLHEIILKNNVTSVLELGTSIGYSTLWMAYALQQTGGHIHTVERSANKIPVAQQHFADAEMNSFITLHHGDILPTLQTLPDDLQFDLVFMDADRGHYHEYFLVITKHLSPGAVILADNAGNMGSRMQPFFDLLTAEGWNWEIKDMDNGILITYPSPR